MRFPWHRKPATLQVVHDDDLENVLAGLGILGDIKAGRLKCKFSDDVITLANLHALYPESGAIKLVCNLPTCVIALAEKAAERPND